MVTAALASLGCAVMTPRFDQAVSTAFAHDQMRKYESEALELYYPAAYKDEAMRVARRLSACIGQLRSYPLSTTPRAKFLVYLTTANFNNAYVQPEVVGLPQQMVLAHHMTLEFFNWLELGEAEIGDISCHEATHYVQMQQVDGFWRWVDLITGSYNQSNVFTESWFLEGIATHYEGRLGKETGRPQSPVWNGLFQSIVEARKGNLNPGDLSPENRQLLPFGGNYMVGQQFVDYLARTYGSAKLWQLVDLQGRSLFSPFWVSLRFKSIYGKSTGALFDDFVLELKSHLTGRTRPPGQHVLAKDLGYVARLAVSPSDGAMATVTAGLDDVVRLTVREPDGSVRFSQKLEQFIPPRRWVAVSPLRVSGMSFTADGSGLYFVVADINALGEDAGELWQVDARNGQVGRIIKDIRGMGGGISPDGRDYVAVELSGDTANLVKLNLESGARTWLTHFTGPMSLGAPAFSPDGRRISFSQWTGDGFDLFVLQPDGVSWRLTRDGKFNYGARWADNDNVLFIREEAGRAQVHQVQVSTGVVTRVTDAPFLALDPYPRPNGEVAFLNREGSGWSLDSTPLPSRAAGPPWEAPREPSAVTSADLPEPTLPPGADTAYSPADHLFLPVLHTPLFYVYGSSRSGFNVLEGASLSGSDRLGLHNYAVNVWHEQHQNGPNVTLDYGNYQLAPWFLSGSVSRRVSRLENFPQTDWQGNISASRSFWTTPLTFGINALERSLRLTKNYLWRVKLVGPSASISYAAVESTPYGGGKRGIGVSLAGTYYPRQLESDYNLADTRAQVDAYLPVPGLLRHSLRVSLTGRAVVGGAPKLLELGGNYLGLYQWQDRPQTSDNPGKFFFLPNVAFQEALRGYEDHTVYASRAALFNAVYRYPFIIEYGWASTLYLLPSLFVRQLDVELFAAAARTDVLARPWHRDVGGAVFLRTTLGQVLPLSLFYQFSQRFDDGLGGLHVFGLALQ